MRRLFFAVILLAVFSCTSGENNQQTTDPVSTGTADTLTSGAYGTGAAEDGAAVSGKGPSDTAEKKSDKQRP